MAKQNISQMNTGQQDKQLLTLVQLLDKEQPYKEFKNLRDQELEINDNDMIRRMQGSLVGLAIGDALGAPVEFRPNEYLKQHPVIEMQNGGTWGLQAGQWTDDTSMALCLAASLIVRGKCNPYDQFARYKRWYRNGYMSSTGKCFDIGVSTREAITEFENRQRHVVTRMLKQNIPISDSAPLPEEVIEYYFHHFSLDAQCGSSNSAGNGSLMRLAPIPSFFFQSYNNVKQFIDESTKLTHGDQRAIDACQFYAGLIWHALNGVPKQQLLQPNFYLEALNIPLHKDVVEIARGSYRNKKGYEDGIRGKGFVLESLEAALWAFYNDNDSFEKGVLDAINLGDDTDTTAAIYGQLAGAVYGIQQIPERWIKQLFEGKFLMTIAKGLYVKGKQFSSEQEKSDPPNGDGQNHHQANVNSTKVTDRKTNEANPTSSDPDVNKYPVSHYDPAVNTPNALRPRQVTFADRISYRNHPTRTNSASDHRRFANVDNISQRGQPASTNNMSSNRQLANTNNTPRLEQSASASNLPLRRQAMGPDNLSRQREYDYANSIAQTKQPTKVITET